MSSNYVKCHKCAQSFNIRYFNRHICNGNHPVAADDNQQNTDNNDDDHSSQESEEVECTNETSCIEDKTEDNNEDEIVDEDLFQELFREASFLDGDETTCEETSKLSILITWCCLFLAYWQYTFNITDNALEALIKFFFVFFKVYGEVVSGSKEEVNSASSFPPSLYMFHKFLSMKKSYYKKYVVCRKWYSLYDPDKCVSYYRGEKISATCAYVKFSNHRLKHYRKKCGEKLMRVIKSPSGVTILVPFKSYCYRSIQKSLEVLTNREGFETDCEKWRNLKSYPDTYSDTFDGEIWKKFSRTGEWYFSEPRHYAVMLNIDWFQPFKHLSSYSIGGIYLVVLNLPRVERFKRENVILVGIIPNMQKEPPTNTFIAPLISELNTAWHQGFTITVCWM